MSRRRDHLKAVAVGLGRFVACILTAPFILAMMFLMLFLVVVPIAFFFMFPVLLVLGLSHPVGLVAPKTGDRLYGWADGRILRSDPGGELVDRVFDLMFWPWEKIIG